MRFILLALSALAAWAAGGVLLSHPGAFSDPISDRFGIGNAGIFTASSPDLFSEQSKGDLRHLDDALRKSGLCDAVIDLASFPAASASAEETDMTPLLDRTDAKAKALADPDLVGALVDAQGTTSLFICLLRTQEDWPAFVHLWRAQTLEHLQLDLAGSLGVVYLLARDLMLSGTLILLVALPLMLVLAFFERRYGRQFYVWGALAFLPLIATATVVNLRGVRLAPSPLATVLGGRAGQAMQALSLVTNADDTWLIDAAGDFSHAAPLHDLAAFCQELGPGVSCPTQALTAAAQALTGSNALPATNEQWKALSFLVGSRPELRLLFDHDFRHALVRVRGHPSPEAMLAVANTHRLTATIGGLPAINRALRRAVLFFVALICVSCVVAVFVGRKTGWGSVTLGGGWVAASIVTPVGAAAMFLLTLGALTLFASLGATGVTGKDLA